jgi:hypothetical protein
VDVDLLVFDILNTFHHCWFLSWDHLMANTVSAQKAEDGKLSWVEFTPQFHSHLVKCAVALVPRPVRKVKRVLFVFILELLNREGNAAFFELQKGSRKANNAQKEKWCLTWKRSRAAKRERDREATKVADVPIHMRSCQGCRRHFTSQKTASWHKCPNSKVVREPVEAAEIKVSQPRRSARLGKPTATITPLAPIARPSRPPHRRLMPAVTGDSRDNPIWSAEDLTTPTQLGTFLAQEEQFEAQNSCMGGGWEPSVGSRKRPRVMSPGFDRSTTF